MAKIVVDDANRDNSMRMSDVKVGTIFTWGDGVSFYIRTKHELHNIESGAKELFENDYVFDDYREVIEVVLKL